MAHELGEELHAVRMTYAWRIFSFLPLLLFALIVAAIVANAKKPLKSSEIFGMAMTSVALLVPVVLVWRWHAKIRVRVFEHGIVHENGSRSTEIKWSDILYVRFRAVRQNIHGVNVGTNHYVTLVASDKRKIKLSNNLKEGGRLIDHVLKRILEEQIPKFTQLIQMGNQVPFGKISIGQEGLIVKSKLAAWNSISDVTVVKGHVKVLLPNKWKAFYSARFSDVPNGHAFIHLCNQFLGKRPLSDSANVTETQSN